MVINKKRASRKNRLIGVGLVLVVALLLDITSRYYQNKAEQAIALKEAEVVEVIKQNEVLKQEIENLKFPVGKAEDLNWVHSPNDPVVSSVSKRDVIFSNYYTGDGSSGSTTASGLSTSDFSVNGDGFYTYDGLVVVATASNRLEGLKEGFITHELYDQLVLVINDRHYEAIVLDVCGTCTWGKENETLQRVDVFTTHDVLGLTKGKVYE